MPAQIDIFEIITADRCGYGAGTGRRSCDQPATHRACWSIPPLHRDGTPNSRAGSGGVDCCRDHANYYASAWFPIYPAMTDSTWIEVLVLEAAA